MNHSVSSTISYYASDKEIILFVEGFSPITIINNNDDYENYKEDLIFVIKEYNESEDKKDKEFYFDIIKNMIYDK